MVLGILGLAAMIVLGCRLLLEEGLLFNMVFIFADADFLVFV